MDSSPPNPRTSSDAAQLPRAYAIRSERERLLEAMVRTVAAKGYEETAIDAVVEVAGLPQQTFERMFASKEACFLEAYDAVVEVLLAHVAAAYESAAAEPWPERIGAALRALLELLAAEAEIARMAIVDVTAVGEHARIRFREALERFVPFLDAGREASPRGEELPEGTARFAIGAVTAMIFDEVRGGRGSELPRILPELAFAVLTPYLGPEGAEAEMRRLSR